MKICIAILLAIQIMGCNSHFQKKPDEFEGIIYYTVSASSKKQAWHMNEEIQSMFGDTLVCYYKKGKYRMSFNGKDLSEVYYFSDSNMEYTVRNNIDSLFVGECSMVIDKFEKLTEFDTTETVCGHKCSGIEVKSDVSTRTYLFSDDLYMDPKHYEKHTMGNLDKYYSKAQSPFLIYVYDGKAFQTTYRAFKIEPKTLDDRIFELPDYPKATLKG